MYEIERNRLHKTVEEFFGTHAIPAIMKTTAVEGVMEMVQEAVPNRTMNPVLYRYKETEIVISAMDGFTPSDGWEPLYSQAQFNQLQAQLVRQQASYEAEIKVEVDAALDRMTNDAKDWGNGLNTAGWAYLDSFSKNVNEAMTGRHYNNSKTVVRETLLAYFDAIRRKERKE